MRVLMFRCKTLRILSVTVFSFSYLSLFFTSSTSANPSEATAQINIGDEKNIQILIPLLHSERNTTFTQGSIQNGVYSLGFGHRIELNEFLFGINSFYTMDENDHSRLSLGIEASTENFLFNANTYFGLDNWQLEDNLYTKTANGFDLKLSARSSDLPSLLGSIAYTKFDGQSEQFKLGVSYQPIPLIAFNVDYDISHDDIIGYIQFRYRFGESFADQLRPENLPKFQSLQAQRLDPVQFNTNLLEQTEVRVAQDTRPSIDEQDIVLTAVRDVAPVKEFNRLEAKVMEIENGQTHLLDDVVVQFKTEDTVLGVATSKNGLARLDFTSNEALTLDVFSIANGMVSNTVRVKFEANESETPAELPAPVTPTEPPIDPVTPTEPPVDPVTPTEPPVDPVTPTEPPVDPADPSEPPVIDTCLNMPVEGNIVQSRTSWTQIMGSGAGGRITNVKVTGQNIAGGIVTISYYFEAPVVSYPLEGANFTVYVFGEEGTTLGQMEDAFLSAGNKQVSGWNSFKLPPIMTNQAGKTVEVSMRPYNGRGIYLNDVTVSFDVLPADTVICQP